MSATNLPVPQMDFLGARQYYGSDDIFSLFYGPRTMPHHTDPYEKRPMDIMNMPEAYRLRELSLQNTVEDWMWTAMNTWYTDRILPWRVVDDIHLQWTKFTAHAHILDFTPYQTPSHLMTNERSIRRASLVRRGIRFRFEHDFVKTAMGRSVFLSSLGQIARSVQETANYEVIQALIHAHRLPHQWKRENDAVNSRTLMEYLNNDRERFAMAQKVENGLEQWLDDVNEEMQQRNGRANALIIPEKLSNYIQYRPEKWPLYLAGQAGPDRINGGPTEKRLAAAGTSEPLDRVEPTRWVKDVPVFIQRSKYVEGIGSNDMMTRVRQIGDYVVMMNTQRDLSEYKTEGRSIAIYNEDIDDFSEITLQDAIQNCHIFDKETGGLRPVFESRLYNASTQSRDLLRDFLVRQDPQSPGEQVRFIGDINEQFLSTNFLLEAAQTIKNHVGEMPNAPVLTNMTKDTMIGPFSSDIPALRLYFNDLRAVLGLEIEDAQLYEMLYADGLVPVVQAEPTVPGAARVESQADDRFFRMVRDAVPEEKHEDVNAIIVAHYTPGDTVHNAAKELQSQILQWVDAKEPNFKFRSKNAVKKYFTTNIKKYEEDKQQEAEAPAPAVSVQGDVKIAGYVAPGLDLSNTPYRYLHEGSKRPHRVPFHNFASHPEHLYHVRLRMDQQGQRSQRGTGVAGIGRLAYGDKELQKARDMTAAEVRKAHLDGLAKKGASTDLKNLAKLYLMLGVTRGTMMTLADNDILLPMNFLLMRPHQTYRTRTVIKVQMDGGAGYMFYGRANIQVQHEGSTKTGQCHYTNHMGAVIMNPENVYVQPDMMVDGYLGGCGNRFFTPDSYATKDPHNMRESIICAPLPPSETELPLYLHAAGRFYTTAVRGLITKEQFQQLHYSTALRMNQLFGFWSAESRIESSDMPSVLRDAVHNNLICCRGHQFNKNQKTGNYDHVFVNKGHWGPNVYAGCHDARVGRKQYLKEIDWTRYSAL